MSFTPTFETPPIPSSLDRDIRTTALSNGIKVITETMPHVRSVSVGVWVGSGSRREAAEQSGVSHFIEHMLFKGTETRSAEDIARSVDSIGGNLDAFTAKEMTCFNTKVLDEHVPIAMDVLSDLVLNPRFDEQDIGKEKSVVLEEIKMDADSPDYLVHEIFSAQFWQGHSLGRPILGTRDTVRGLSRDVIQNFYRSVYTPENLLITAAGNLSHERLVELAAGHFEKLKPAGPVPQEPVPSTHAGVILRTKKELEQVHLCLGVPSYPIPHEDRFHCYVLNTVLGGGMSSRLFQNIRERQGLAYSVYSDISPYTDTGCLMVCAGTSLESVRQLVDSVLREFKELRQNPVPPEELRRAKDHLKGSLMLSLESTSSRMSNLARQEMHFKRFFSLDELVESIEKVTATDVQHVAQSFFEPSQIALTILGNLNGLKIGREDLVC